jgi:flavin reductase (DIM6/NTAB) family NADH-FMN oxidoreductase RutF
MLEINPKTLQLRPFHVLDDECALLVGGIDRPNPMTVSWGGFGTVWNRPAVTVYVRPTRHTYSCLQESREFTLNFMPPAQQRALDLCGEFSGRDQDKWQLAGISPEPSERIHVPRVAGARLVFECRVMAWLDLDPKNFVDPSVESLYPGRDYHRAYLGEVLGLWGTATW